MMLALSFNRGVAELTVKKAPFRLVWTTFSKMASSVVPVGVLPEMPALAKRMSSLPKSLESSTKEFLAVLLHCNVGAIAARFRSESATASSSVCLIPAGNRDFSAFCNEKARCGQPDATVSTGDEAFFL